MGIDVSQFHQIFFEESFEGLQAMESALLALSQGSEDNDLINLIFRAAHSIKGGSGTFGFSAVADFTHVMETLLDEMRDGRREVTRPALDLLLESGDVLRDMLTAARDGCAFDAERAAAVQASLEGLLGSQTDAGGTEVSADVDVASSCGWGITFKPHPHLLKTGNEPVRMFRELSQLGALEIEASTERVPGVEGFDPEDCYLSWTLKLSGAIDRTRIDEIFEWVDGDCDLEVIPLSAVDKGPQAAAVVPADIQAVPEAEERRQDDRRSGAERRREERSGGAGSETQKTPDSSIRVSISKIDELINMVGELVITQSMLGQIGSEMEDLDISKISKLRDGLAQLERNTRELQESVMLIRMLPISFAFNRFPRLVHDLSAKLGKKIDLKISGESTELDKTVMEKIGDPLVHLVRNSLDHGIEAPEVRLAKGKPETGVIHLNAFHQGGNIVIEINDDGGGLPAEKILDKARQRGLVGENEKLSHERILELIFEPGFSTADTVSDVSGRGVGMDVVRRNIKDLGGTVEARSEADVGSTFTIRLPLTLAILDGQLLSVGAEIFIMPLISIVESLQVDMAQVNTVAGSAEMYKLREDYIPVVRLYELFGIESKNRKLDGSLLVVVESDGHKIGLMVDELLGQQQVVIKSLETNLKRIKGISGATILGDGTVALIMDVGDLIQLGRSFPGRDRLHLVDVNGNAA